MTIHRSGSGNFLENPQRTEEAESKGGSGRHFAPASFISFYRDCQLPFPVLKI
ncbi:general stress protein [Pantoea sp. ANP04]|uniref:general stress protein n=1 Tax=Pantoea sp. ANP04 TaxID=3064896 RepID=UPI0035C5F9E9